MDAITPDQLEVVAIPDAVMGKWAGHTDISLMRANGESMNRVIPNGSLIGAFSYLFYAFAYFFEGKKISPPPEGGELTV